MDLQKKFIKSHDGLKLYYETHGLGSGKRVIFFVHGVGGDVDAWEFVRNPLLAQGFSSISMDLRGHGYSDHPRTKNSYQLENLSKDIIAILDEEKIDKVNLIGHSFGSIVSTFFAIEHPERLENLVIISGTHGPPNYLRTKIAKSLANFFIDFAASISPKPYRAWHSLYPKGKFHKDYEAWGLAKTIFFNSWASYLLTSKQSVNLDIRHKLSKIKTPTLVIVGTNDSVFHHSVSAEIQAQIPNSRLEMIEGANHVVILNNPNETAALIQEFLKIN